MRLKRKERKPAKQPFGLYCMGELMFIMLANSPREVREAYMLATLDPINDWRIRYIEVVAIKIERLY